jgi:hypothetical protein
MLLPAPFPAGEPFVKRDGTLSDAAFKWLAGQGAVFASAPKKIASIDLTLQSASIGSTQMFSGALSAGQYLVEYYIQVTRAATVSSDFTFSLGWTNFAVTQSYTGVLKNGNLTTTYEQAGVTFRADENTPITYAVAYNSAGATSMQFCLRATLWQLDA